jgi:phenylalanyl-tRNA synthetase beta chain
MRRDLSVVVDQTMPYQKIDALIQEQKLALLKKVNVFDVFEGKPLDEGKKAVAIAFYLGKEGETLTDEAADEAMNKLMTSFEKAGAVIRR